MTNLILHFLDKEALENTWKAKTKMLIKFLEIDNWKSNQDILFFSIIDWGFRYQRPQHLAKNFADNGHRVYYFNTALNKHKTKLSKSKNVNIVEFYHYSIDGIYEMKM